MDAASRRQAILDRLRAADRPVSASALASELNVSRQIIVGDIALLRAGGAEISATPRGYVLPRATDGITRTIACRHTLAQTGQELDILVDNGCSPANSRSAAAMMWNSFSRACRRTTPPR